MNDTHYGTLTQIGSLYGVTRNKVGGWLREAGLRDRRGNPTSEGLMMTLERPTPNGRRTFYVWHLRETIAVLDSLGHRRKPTYGYVGGP